MKVSVKKYLDQFILMVTSRIPFITILFPLSILGICHFAIVSLYQLLLFLHAANSLFLLISVNNKGMHFFVLIFFFLNVMYNAINIIMLRMCCMFCVFCVYIEEGIHVLLNYSLIFFFIMLM